MDQENRSVAPETDEQKNLSETHEAQVMEELQALLHRLPEAQTLSNAQKDRERKLLRERLKALNAVPRSDWHREFENLLQIEVESWENGAVIDREVSIGEDAPRTDFIVVSETELAKDVKSVFRFFRKKNALEYKRPAELLTEQMLWKTAGYGNLLIGTGQDTQYNKEELTLSIFAYRKNEAQFAAMVESGLLQATEAKGIYRVIGMTPLPYQVVIAGELEGREYAAFRALSDRTSIGDVSVILDAMKVCSLQSRDRYFSILQTIEAHNPGQVRDMIREENKSMRDIFIDLFEPEIQERERQAAEAAKVAAEAAAKVAAEAAAKAAAEVATTTAYNTFAERLINSGVSGPIISDATGYDRSHIDSIAQRLNRTVRWNESRV